MKVTITLDYWNARHLLDVVRRAQKTTIFEKLAITRLYEKLGRAQCRVKKAADVDEFGGMHFPEGSQRIIADDLRKSRVKEEQ